MSLGTLIGGDFAQIPAFELRVHSPSSGELLGRRGTINWKGDAVFI